MAEITGEITEQKKPYWGPWPTVGFGCGILVAGIIVTLVVIIIFLIVKFVNDSTFSIDKIAQYLRTNGLYFSISTIVTAVVCVGLIALIIKWRHTLSITEYLGLQWISVKTLLISLAIGIGVAILMDGLTYLLKKPVVTEWQLEMFTATNPVMLWLSLIVFTPIFEETLFRGFLFEGFRHSRIGVIGAVILTAFLWAISHVQYDTYGIAQIFVLGIVLGIVRFKTGSLWSTISMHALINLIATVETVFYVTGH